MNDNILRIISRIANSQDGIEFVDYLKVLSVQNYEAYKKDASENNDIHKGYAIAIDSLISVFSNCDELLRSKEYEQEVKEWI